MVKNLFGHFLCKAISCLNEHSSLQYSSYEVILSSSILVGNSFPLSLVRRAVLLRPVELSEFQRACVGRRVVSFWGHANTLSLASRFAGCDLSPLCARPVIRCSEAGYPCLDGEEFRECWVLSPDYIMDFRPAVGEELPADKIAGWQILHLTWYEDT